MESTACGDEIREQTGYFLAGHQAQAGMYHETQTGREIRMNEAGVLPATCDGHVAVYIRRPSTWAEIAGQTDEIKRGEIRL